MCLNFEFDYSDRRVRAAAGQHEVLRVGPELEAGDSGVVTLGVLVDDHEGAGEKDNRVSVSFTCISAPAALKLGVVCKM